MMLERLTSLRTTYIHQHLIPSKMWPETNNPKKIVLQNQTTLPSLQQIGDTQHDVRPSKNHMPWENMCTFYLGIKHWPTDIKPLGIEGSSPLIETMLHPPPNTQLLQTYTWNMNLAKTTPQTDGSIDYATARVPSLSQAKWTNRKGPIQAMLSPKTDKKVTCYL